MGFQNDQKRGKKNFLKKKTNQFSILRLDGEGFTEYGDTVMASITICHFIVIWALLSRSYKTKITEFQRVPLLKQYYLQRTV